MRNRTDGKRIATFAPSAAAAAIGRILMLQFLRQLLGRIAPATDSGSASERLAADWLRRERGFKIVARNWRNPADRREEIDLVGREGEVLVFVEVKARAAGALVPGYHAVDERKKRVLRRAAEAYLAGLRVKPRAFRLDVIEVMLPTAEDAKKGARPEVLHFENVPLFGSAYRG